MMKTTIKEDFIMYCKHCGSPMNANQAVCLQCGVKAGEGKSHCHHCGSPLPDNADVCLSCGVAVPKNNTNRYLNGQDKLVMILICFFIGGLGIHNFMMGENKKGLFKIATSFCCGLGWIFALIDLVKIAMDTYVVDPEKLI
jgi:TM2 domain-containing membrane protein YozV